MEPVLNFYYRYWFRCEVEGIENVPAAGGALLASNHSGALPPDAPMIMQAIRNEHPHPRPALHAGRALVQGLSRASGCWPTRSASSRRTPPTPTGCCTTRAGSCWSSPRARRARASSSGSATSCDASAAAASSRPRSARGVPIVPVAVMGAEEAMPIFAHVPLLQRLTGLIYFPINHAFPHFGLLAGGDVPPGEVQDQVPGARALRAPRPRRRRRRRVRPADRGRRPARIQDALNEMLGQRKSVWFG